MMDVFEIEEPNDVIMTEGKCEQVVEMFPFLSELNPEQRQAVEHTEGPLLVLSGAGTGKTRVLTTRTAYIIEKHLAKPYQILAVTFTNKAANEMKLRLEKMIGSAAFSVWLGTFHAIGVKILRKYAEKLNLTSDFTVLSADDQERLIKNILTERGIDVKKYDPATVLEIIQRWKDRGLLPQEVDFREKKSQISGLAFDSYQTYQNRLHMLNAVDFGDLLLLPIVLFRENPDVLEEYQTKFRYILVDEYQDTNVAQYLLLRLLAQKWHNICCVGDDDQSIYSWRGAEVGNILSFKKFYPDADIIRLERNYRSTAHILGAASGLISHNESRLGKTLKPADDNADVGQKVTVKGFWNDMQEADWVSDQIEFAQKRGVLLSQMAILVRATFQTRLFEDTLRKKGIPYKIIGGFKFYEREEIKDAVAYLRLILNSNDDLAFLRVVNKPKRGVGAKALEAVTETAREKKVSLFDAVAWAPLKGTVRQSLDSFIYLIKRAQEKAQTATLPETARFVLEESGYMQLWQQEKSPEADGRIENIEELYNVLHDYDTIRDFVEYASLVSDTDETGNEDQLIVMTLHASKGLEFQNVYLTGWEEELFPHKKALDESGTDGLEEERRLAYVGLTRARKFAAVTYANNRRMYGHWVNALPSRFIEELPPEHITMTGTGSRAFLPADRQNYFDRRARDFDSDADDGSVFDKGQWKRETFQKAAYDFYDRSPVKVYQTKETGSRLGKRVRHEIFGTGTVIRAEGERLDVRFDSGEIKKIMARFLEEI